VDIDTAVKETGTESELAVSEMAGASVGACVELSEVVLECCPSSLTGEGCNRGSLRYIMQR